MDEASNKILESLLKKVKPMSDFIETIDPEIFDDEDDVELEKEIDEDEEELGSE